MRPFTLAVFSLLLTSTAFTATSTDMKPEREVTVQGTGKIKAIPDIARLSISIQEEGSRVEDITPKVRSTMETILRAIKNKGVAEKDIQTQSYQVSPRWSWNGGKQRLDGYTASNQIQVTVRDLKATGGILSAALDAGANSIQGPQFDFNDPTALEHQALAAAMSEAKNKASLLAQAADSSLGEIVTINESGINFPTPRFFATRRGGAMAMMAADAATPEPIQAGEENVTATLTATFALK